METISFTNQKTGQVIDVPVELLNDAFKPYTDGFRSGFTTAFWQTSAALLITSAITAGAAYGTYRFLKYRENRKAQTEN